ncbi:MAG TPA: type II toxin-antitoxin system PemK/MazF family toxin [Polyangiaceae bacterium]|nr:type II toxin-antitoxin system PemK/MazF family toxin [Polyangiaceae bacterium]
MAGRGEVLALRRAVGFLPGSELSRFIVMQTSRLAPVLETVLVIPLDEPVPDYTKLPGLVPVTAAEAGTKSSQLALATQLTCLALSRFEPTSVGRVRPSTLARLDRVLRFVLELP